MALKFSSTNDVHLQGVKALVYGVAGAGKTTLATTVPRPVIISAENGLLSIAGSGIGVLEVESFEDLKDAYQWCVNPANQGYFDTIFLDSISEIAEQVLLYAKSKVKDARLAYVELGDKLVDIIKDFRDIKGKHVIMIAKIEHAKEEVTGVTKYFPSVPGNKLTQRIPYLFDEVLYLGVKTDPVTNQSFRFIQTQPDFQVSAKDRSGKLAFTEPPNMGLIINKISGVNPNG